MTQNILLLGKYLSKKTFLVFYVGSQAQLRVLSRWLCIIASLLPFIMLFLAMIIMHYQFESGDFDLIVFVEKYQLTGAIQFDTTAAIVSWIIRFIFCRLCLDKTTIIVRKIDPNFSLLINYCLVNHPVLDHILCLRMIFYWERKLFVERKAKIYSKKQGLWVYRVLSCYAMALKIDKIERTLFKSQKELAFSNKTSTIKFAEMLKTVSNSFDRSDLEVNVLRQAKFGKTIQYLHQISKESGAEETVTV